MGCLSEPLLPAVDDVVTKYGETTVHDLCHKSDIHMVVLSPSFGYEST